MDFKTILEDSLELGSHRNFVALLLYRQYFIKEMNEQNHQMQERHPADFLRELLRYINHMMLSVTDVTSVIVAVCSFVS